MQAEPVRRIYDNGLTLLHQYKPGGLLSVQYWVKSGSIHEGAALGCGLSHFLEHMLFKGTPKRGPQDISRAVHATGGYCNAYTSFDRTVYYIDAPTEAAADVFDILGDMMGHAALPEAEFTTERDVILREIDMDGDDPDRVLFQQFTATAFRQHPYRFPIIGHRPLFTTITRDDLVDYYQRRYAPNNAVLVVTGSLDLAALEALVDTHFASHSMRRVEDTPLQDEPPQLARREVRIHKKVNMVRGMIGYRIPGLTHMDGPALQVLAGLLGRGQSSRLWQRLREQRQLVHHIEASCFNPGQTGVLFFNYVCDPGKRADVERALAEELEALPDSAIAESEIAKMVRQAEVREIDGMKTVSGLAARLGSAEVVAGDMAYPQIQLERLRSVTVSQLQQVAVRYLITGVPTLASLEPQAVNRVTQQRPDSQWDAFSETRLENGLRLLMQPSDALNKVSFRVVFRGGPNHEPAGASGATGVLATLLTRDTTRHSAAEVATLTESHGMHFSELCGNNTFGLSIECLPEDVELASSLLADALLRPAFTDNSFLLERDGQLASLLEDEDEILDYGRRRLRERLFAGHPFSTDYLGKVDDLQALSKSTICELYRRQVVGNNTVIAVSGQFDAETLTGQLRAALTDLPQGDIVAEAPALPAMEAGAHRYALNRDQAVLLIGYRDGGIRSRNYCHSELLDECFSGMASPLFQRVREEKGLAYYVGSSRVVGLDYGLFHFYAGTHPDQVEAVQQEIAQERQRVQAGDFLPGELDACRRHLCVRKRKARQTPGARAMEAALDVSYGRGANTWKDYDAAIQAVTAEQLAEYASQVFREANQVSVTVLPANREVTA